MRLRYTTQGAVELNEVLTYISSLSPQGSRRVKSRIHSIVNLLLQHPFAGRLTSNSRLRRMTASPYPYIIFYETTDDELIIHAIRHAARNPASMPGSTGI